MRNSLNLILSLMVTVVLATGVARARTEVQIFPFVESPSDRPVRLGLMASPLHGGTSDFEEVETLEILPAKRAGERHFLGRVELARILEDKLPSQHNLSFRIPNQIVVESKKNFISAYDVEKVLLARAKEKCPSCRLEIRDLKIPEVKAKANLVDWKVDDSQIILRGSILLPLRLRFDDGQTETRFVSARLIEEQKVLVARRSLKPGERITGDDYEVKWVDTTYLKESPLRIDEISSQQVAKYLPAGRPLVSGDLAKEPGTLRGQIIKLIAGDQDLEVSTQGIAEEQGSVGDMVKVKIPDSQKFVSGKIIEKGVVRIQ